MYTHGKGEGPYSAASLQARQLHAGSTWAQNTGGILAPFCCSKDTHTDDTALVGQSVWVDFLPPRVLAKASLPQLPTGESPPWQAGEGDS